MNVYEAIMKAADHIEMNPHLFNFTEVRVPSCSTPGCAVGWIAHFRGMEPRICGITTDAGAEALGYCYNQFIYQMDDLNGVTWRFSAEKCAAAMRLYAKKYHAKPSQTAEDFMASLKVKINGERIPEDA